MKNGSAVKLRDIQEMTNHGLREYMISQLMRGRRISAWFIHRSVMYVVVANDNAKELEISKSTVEGPWQSLSNEYPAVSMFERELAEKTFLEVHGHPYLMPVRKPRPEKLFSKITGHNIHAVGVGPVMGGVSESQYFRFQCHGEEILDLDQSMGYQHRGIERQLSGPLSPRMIHYIETAAGDSTIGHTIAFCMNLEAIADHSPSVEATKIRALALELERLANHIGDLGNICGDVGYIPALTSCLQIREDILNLTEFLCGSRFGRGLIKPGGVSIKVDQNSLIQIGYRLEKCYSDFKSAIALMFNSPSTRSRFERCGTLTELNARKYGMVGVTARASRIARDIRYNFPQPGIPVYEPTIARNGDVYDRAKVRWREIRCSVGLIVKLIESFTETVPVTQKLILRPDMLAVSLVEGWRGEICHIAISEANNKLAAYKIVDPSFRNWEALRLIMKEGQISDFPLCCRSFSLSCSGVDL